MSSVVEQGLVVTGDIFGEVDLTVRGIVRGSIFLQNANVFIEQSGYIQGEVRADKIVVAGEVLGDITAETALQVTATAKVRGNSRASKLAMADEAFFSGGLEIQEPEPVELEIRDFKTLTEDDYTKLRRWRKRNRVE